MLIDYRFTSCSRRCSATGRQLQPGEDYYSALVRGEGSTERRDFAAEAWQGPPPHHLAWWRSQVPSDADARPQLAPSDVLLNLFAKLAEERKEVEFRYLLGLLLIRKKLLRHVETFRVDDGRELMSLDCPRRQQQYELVVAEPDAEDADQLQQRIVDLLYHDGQ